MRSRMNGNVSLPGSPDRYTLKSRHPERSGSSGETRSRRTPREHAPPQPHRTFQPVSRSRSASKPTHHSGCPIHALAHGWGRATSRRGTIINGFGRAINQPPRSGSRSAEGSPLERTSLR